MPRYRLFIEFLGTGYAGWQKQPEQQTIQGTIEQGLERVLRHPVQLVGQGRTDSGVHARKQVAHFDTEPAEELDCTAFQRAMLGVLPRDIAVWSMEKVDEDFHARFDAQSRVYEYRITTRPSPLHENIALLHTRTLDFERMRQAAEMVRGKHDFRAFGKVEAKDYKGSVCEVTTSEWQKEGHLLIYRIAANRFIRHLVRRLVGTMMNVGESKLSLGEFDALLNAVEKESFTLKEKGEREEDGPTVHMAPARGLVLEDVNY